MHFSTRCIVLLFALLKVSGCSILDRDFSDEEIQLFNDYPAQKARERLAGEVKVTYFGTSTLLFEDDETKIMIDGYFSRPTLGDLLSFEPDKVLITNVIEKYELDDLKVILPVHSHHDHAMDAPLFAQFTDAKLLGTESSYLVGKELKLNKNKWEDAKLNHKYHYGDFTITLFPARHGHLPFFLRNCLSKPNEINKPIQYPACICDYKESQSYSVHIKHKNTSFLIHASTAYIDGTLEKVKSDYIFLGIAGLSELKPKEQQYFFDETVGSVKGSKLIPIHWDDFMRSKNDRLYPAKRLMGSFENDIKALIKLNQENAKPAKIILLQKEDSIITLSN